MDLPGLIHSSNKVQSDEDVTVIKNLVNDYIAEKRTIILAVVSAKNDYANQIILERCRSFDPEGTRTLGIITKPDFLRPDSDNESTWLDLAQNKDIYFELGWHILKNRSDEEHSLSFLERNFKESQFFGSGKYKKLSKDMKGIDSLRHRLSLLLFHHLKRELPKFRAELDTMAQETSEEIEKLGQARSTLTEQRVYLTELYTSGRDLLTQGSKGDYDHRFFGALNLNKSVMEGNNAKRLRAVVQSLNMDFAKMIRRNGRSYVVSDDEIRDENSDEEEVQGDFEEEEIIKEDEEDEEDEADHKDNSDDDSQHNSAMLPESMTHREEVQHVIDVMTRSKGRELQGTFNPLLIRDLFQELSTKWEPLARAHIAAVLKASEHFVFEVLQRVAVKEVKDRLRITVVQPNLKSNQTSAMQEFAQIMTDKQRHAITYNHYFSVTFQKRQQERRAKLMRKSSEAAKVTVEEWQKHFGGTISHATKQYLSPEKFEQKLGQVVNADSMWFLWEPVDASSRQWHHSKFLDLHR